MIKSNIKREFECDIKSLWDIITDNTNYSWRSDLSKIDIIDDTHFVEYSQNNFPTYFVITTKEKYQEYKFDLQNDNITGKWTGIFKKLDNNKVLVDFTEEIKTDKFLIKLLAKPYLKRQQKRFLEDLEKEIKRKLYNNNDY